MGVIMSMVKTLKEFVMKKKICTVLGKPIRPSTPIPPKIHIINHTEHTEINRPENVVINRVQMLSSPEDAFVVEINRIQGTSPEDVEINWVHEYHDAWAERIKQTFVGDDLETRLEDIAYEKQRRLEAAPAVVKRRAVKIQQKAEREADPVKMAKYLDKCENARYARARSQAKYTLKEQTEMNRKRNAFRVRTYPKQVR
jgi:hypothetical protein